MTKPRYRLAVDCPLAANARVSVRENVAHYLTSVLRLQVGAELLVFSKADGEWLASIEEIRKKEVVLALGGTCLRAPVPPLGLTVCFAPIKGGRLETIIEKATELGASVLQPVITARTIVDKVNLVRAEAIAREAAEQCERIDWPELREPVKLLKLLGEWPSDVPLVYGDESGQSAGIQETVTPGSSWGLSLSSQERWIPAQGRDDTAEKVASPMPQTWAVLAGPEGGFTPEELVALKRVKAAVGVGLGPRILRADTAVITLCVATLMAWGDWHERPRFTLGTP
jgi:16S rRNA (uracil1498-N3)-methyltransferase